MSIYELGATITVTCYVTSPGTGALTAPDSAPSLLLSSPSGNDREVSLSNPSTGEYVGTFLPDTLGRWVGEFTAVVDGKTVIAGRAWTVRDTTAEEAGLSFPDGRQSWGSAVT